MIVCCVCVPVSGEVKLIDVRELLEVEETGTVAPNVIHIPRKLVAITEYGHQWGRRKRPFW